MPTIAVDKADLFERLGREYTTEEFDRLCFEYGLELDEDVCIFGLTVSDLLGPNDARSQTTEDVDEAIKKGLPAERPVREHPPDISYDLLCLEGISRVLKVFLGKAESQKYSIVYPPGGEKNLITVHVHPDTKRVRPLFACAVLRNLKFTPRSYASFIDLQDKLHQNIGRRRWLVSIGTHDLDTIEPPFRYEARDPEAIKFVPLMKKEEYTAKELMSIYENDKHLAKYLPIIRDASVYPIIYDQQDRVLSSLRLLTLNTLQIVVNMVSTMFSEYCEEPFTIEPCKIVFPDGSTRISPDIAPRTVIARASYINSCTSLSLSTTSIAELLTRMSHVPTVSPGSDEITVTVLALARIFSTRSTS
ncbi:hypothetical protein JVT61DRAFT_12978 [Boletus reticuloceps]|uniref:phenylalanine--tRNA ligase n=1 Tax=Boletus reticuloceps TaxID=495285 RepID=A0A8I3AB58_9AGAM|nr:hypothetical protein JVT61DRAFT_12978 [Boletus reticuloceps]